MYHLELLIEGLKIRKEKEMSREKEYVVDSTKGSSVINPLNYKGDVLVQVWVDSRVLATLCRWMDGKGQYTRFMSQVVRRPLEVLVGFLVDSGEVELSDDTVESRRMLENRYQVKLNRGNRGGKNVLHNIVLSEGRGELSERIGRRKVVDDANMPRRFANPKVQEVIDKYKELFPEDVENNGRVEKIKNSVDDSRVITDESRTLEIVREGERKSSEIEFGTLREGTSQNEIEKRMKLSKEVEDKENEGLDAFLASVRKGKEGDE